MQISTAARSQGLRIAISTIMINNTISKLADALIVLPNPSPSFTAPVYAPETQFDLSPIQQFHFDSRSPGLDLLDLPFLLRLRRTMPTDRIQEALLALVQRHPMLRARFTQDQTSKWSQYISESTVGSLQFKHFNHRVASELGELIAECRSAIDIQDGPSFIAALIEEPDGEQLLFLTAHHLVIDFVSWRVLFQDIEDFLTLQHFTTPMSVPFQHWTILQSEYAAKNLHPEVILNYQPVTHSLEYWGLQGTTRDLEPYMHTQFCLNEITTAALLGVSKDQFQIRPHELMMAALIYSFSQTFEDRMPPPIFTEGHGRQVWDDSIDLSQTIGWFTVIFPVQTNVHHGDDLLNALSKTKDSIRTMSSQGWSYFASKYLNEKGKKAFQNDTIEINFNFLGHFQQLERDSSLFEAIPLPPNSEPGGKAPMKTVGVFDVTVFIEKGQIHVDFKYTSRIGKIDMVQRWIALYDEALDHAVDMAKRL